MLGTDFLAHAAPEAVGCTAAPGRTDCTVVIVSIPVVVNHPGIHCAEDVGNRNLLRVLGSAVAAGSAGDEVHLSEDFLHLLHGFEFPSIERSVVLHAGYVVLHLLHAAHSG